MKRGKDRQKRTISPNSLANLTPITRARPVGYERVEVDVFLRQHDAKAWRRLTPLERGLVIEQALEARARG